MCRIRPARSDDLAAITEIYNEAVLTTTATFDTETKTPEDQEPWFRSHNEHFPILVAETQDRVVGWAALSQWSDRCAYRDTAEISLYVQEDYRRRGIGRRLMNAVIHEGQRADLHTVIARIAEGNEHSIALHESAGFQRVGVMKEVGWKFGQRLDVVLLQLIYRDTDGSVR